jgi:hypothetical protein
MNNMLATNQQKLLILDWGRKVHSLEYAHRFESKGKENLNGLLGNTATIISAIVAGMVGLSLPDNNQYKIATTAASALGAIAVAIITGIQTNVKPSEVAEKHRHSSSAYEELRHRIELILVTPGLTSDQVMTQLPIIERDFEKLRQHTPNVSDNNFVKGKNKVDNIGTYPLAMRFDPIP